MDKSITTALMIIISMIMVLMLFNIAYPAVIQGGDAIDDMANRLDDRFRSQIKIIHAAAELDASGTWQDVNGSGQFETFIWVKNVGTTQIPVTSSIDVFFGPEENFTRIPHVSQAGGGVSWSSAVESGGDWQPSTTLRITITNGSQLTSGRYFMRVTTANGITDDYFTGI